MKPGRTVDYNHALATDKWFTDVTCNRYPHSMWCTIFAALLTDEDPTRAMMLPPIEGMKDFIDSLYPFWGLDVPAAKQQHDMPSGIAAEIVRRT